MAARKRHREALLAPSTEPVIPTTYGGPSLHRRHCGAGRLEEIYERNTHFLRDHFEAR